MTDNFFKTFFSVGDTKNLERIEKKLVGDTGYLPDKCDGQDCPYFYDCTNNSEDYDICPLLDPGRR